MLYRAFIDDSADEKRQNLIVAGALIGTHLQWKRVSKQWRARLKQDEVAYFRSTEYFSLRGEFSKFRDPQLYPKPAGSEAATALRNDLEGILLKEEIIGFASSIPLPMFRETVADINRDGRVFDPDPFSAAMQTVMNEISLFLRDQVRSKNNRIAFVCDNGPDAIRLAYAYSEFKRKNKQLHGIIGGFACLDDEKHPPLQAADMTANLGKELTQRLLETGEPIDTIPRLKGVFHKLYGWDEEMVRRLAAITIREEIASRQRY